MVIDNVALYLQDSEEGQVESENYTRNSSEYPPQADQRSMFQEFRGNDWMTGSGGYERFVVDLETESGETGFAVNESGDVHDWLYYGDSETLHIFQD
ncbi:hypothetical protein [Haloarcula marina]|uniref:hypothetical protein n=1 Tax=Haloarcula marina TaxID=2961574 RepID=UPI0020B7BB82|nr:hypothetical protein [Halomicroarcula marina]